MDELMNVTTETMDTTVNTVAEVATEVAPSFLEKHGKDLAKVGVGAVIGAGVTVGVTKLVGFIKKKWNDRKERKAAATAVEPEPQAAEEVPETTQE